MYYKSFLAIRQVLKNQTTDHYIMKIKSIFSHIAILVILCFSSTANAGGEGRVPQTHNPLARMFNPRLNEEHHLAKALQARDENRRAAHAQQQQVQVRRSAPQARPVRTPCVDTLARRTHVHTNRCEHGNVSTNCGPCCKPSVKQYRPAPKQTVTHVRPSPPQPRVVHVQPQPCPPVQVVVSQPRPAPVNVQRIQQAAPRQQLRGSICGNTCNGGCGQHQSTHTVQQTTQSRIIAVYKWHDGRCWNRVWTHNGPGPSSAQVDAFIVSNPNRVFGNRHSYDSFVATARSNSTVRNVAATPTRTTGYTGQQAHPSHAAAVPVQNLSPPIAGNIWGVRPPNAY